MKKNNKTSKKIDKIILSIPGSVPHITNAYYSSDTKQTQEFIKERSRIHEIYIKEQERTKRISLSISAILFIASLTLILFAPKGREELSFWLGGALLVFSAGIAGYKRIWGRTRKISIGADKNKGKI